MGILRKWFGEQPVEKPAPRSGLFSTESNVAPGKIDPAAIHKQIFQRSVKDLKPVDAAGNATATDGTGMDSVDDGMKSLALAYQTLPAAQFLWFAGQAFIGYQLCAALAQHWLIAKACMTPAKDAVRHGYEVTVNDGTEVAPELLEKIRKADIKYKIAERCVDQVNMGRVFGVRIALFLVDSNDPEFYEKPFNIAGVTPGSYRGISQIDPYWITPELSVKAASDPADPDFYNPTWWRVNGKRVHRTHLVIFRNGEVADILKPTYYFGGIPTPQKIVERVYAAERTANEAPLLAINKRLTVMKTDLSKALLNKDHFDRIMGFFVEAQNNHGVKVVGTGDEIAQFDTSLNDLDAVIMTQYQLVAAAANVPATKLLGTTPKGFNSTGEFESKSYHEELESIQEHDLTPLVQRHHMLLIKSEISPNAPFSTEVNWNPVDSPTAADLADINLKKSTTAKTYADAGAIDGTDIRQNLISDPDSGYNGMPDVVPDGPGDREAEAEMKNLLVDNPNADGDGDGVVAEDAADFDPVSGMYDGARIITHQRFLNEAKVQEKIDAADFVVNVTPPFEDEGKLYRMVIDGHHSLAAAKRAGVAPVFITGIPRAEVFNAFTREATDSK